MGTAPRLPELRECLDNAPREAQDKSLECSPRINDSSESLPARDILILPYLFLALM